ncbi:MAG: LysM peptidoglycan-binding domain-containing M23 family metallopeptidase [Treponema sp.]|jgi:murein DD-endopeptidase MepM/ murein hydrolase activator NlpD|nr:LysM peptidoglycan-binding domain-containing M23 family metallopeptidase [Treponema sp.]
MRIKRLFLIVLSLFAALSLFGEEAVHILQRGETIYSVARLYGVSPQAVLDRNGIRDATTVQAGRRLLIPAVAGKGSGGAAYGEYRVERGNTLFSIARRYGISLTELLELNGLAENYALKEGEKLRVPAQSGPQAPSKTASQGAGVPGPEVSGTQPAGQKPAVSAQPAIKPDPALRWPINARDLSYMSGKLSGVMITGEKSEPVRSLTQGTVVSAVPYRGFGRVAIVQVADGYLYVYGGCETLSVKEGDRVGPGTELGKLGIDAKSAKPRLFFLVYRRNNPVDPAKAPRA